MWRTVLSIVAGVAAWGIIVTILNLGLRAILPAYHAAEASLQFTLVMETSRLIEAALTSLAAGAAVSWIAPSAKWAPWVAGFIILAAFVPVHVELWNKFPIWYHLAFLLPLAPLVALGGTLMRMRSRSEARAATAS